LEEYRLKVEEVLVSSVISASDNSCATAIIRNDAIDAQMKSARSMDQRGKYKRRRSRRRRRRGGGERVHSWRSHLQ